MSGSVVPELRFPEFEGEWEARPLSSAGKFSKGKGVAKSDLVSENGIPAVRYGELYTTYGALITDVVSRVPSAEGLRISEGKEVLIPSSGETAFDIATASALTTPGVAIGGDINIFRTEEDPHFIAASIRGVRKEDLAKRAQGISVSHLYGDDIGSVDFHLPAHPEQKKIATFLSAVDAKIAALEAQVERWRTYKRGLMQALFSQTLRFKADDGSDFPDWEQSKLKDHCKVDWGNTALTKKSCSNDGRYLAVSASGCDGRIDHFEYHANTPVLSAIGALCGKMFFPEERFTPIKNTMVFHDSRHPKFLFYYLP